jgi:hypothetical protein
LLLGIVGGHAIAHVPVEKHRVPPFVVRAKDTVVIIGRWPRFGRKSFFDFNWLPVQRGEHNFRRFDHFKSLVQPATEFGGQIECHSIRALDSMSVNVILRVDANENVYLRCVYRIEYIGLNRPMNHRENKASCRTGHDNSHTLISFLLTCHRWQLFLQPNKISLLCPKCTVRLHASGNAKQHSGLP